MIPAEDKPDIDSVGQLGGRLVHNFHGMAEALIEVLSR
jgi:hypothetical protein